MKIFSGKYGWYTSVVSKDLGGNEMKTYLPVSFKRGCEPVNNLNNPITEYSFDLIVREPDGKERKAFFTNYSKKDGGTATRLMILDYEQANKPVSSGVFDEPIEETNTSLDIAPDDLPFY